MKIVMSKEFQRGFIRTLDLSGTKKWPNISNGLMRDYFSIRGDWEDVGKSIQRESNRFASAKK